MVDQSGWQRPTGRGSLASPLAHSLPHWSARAYSDSFDSCALGPFIGALHLGSRRGSAGLLIGHLGAAAASRVARDEMIWERGSFD